MFETALMNPDVYPEKTKEVSLVQTHISFVFITDDYVYKIKKPVNFGFLDFSTLEKRKYYCEQELILNRRTAADIYIDVLPVISDGKKVIISNFQIPHSAFRIVDYAVKMKRLPLEYLMKNRLERGDLLPEHIRRIASAIADFHKNANTSNVIESFGLPENIRKNTDENFEQTDKYIGITISEEQYKKIKEWTEQYYIYNEDIFKERIAENKIRDCHGDIHMEHVFVTDERVLLFDCIEFNDRFRYSDVASDIAFLAMDLDFHGQFDYSDSLIKYYCEFMADNTLSGVLLFYKVYRAYVRGKVNSFMLSDPYISNEKKEYFKGIATKYFQLIDRYINTD